MESTAVDSGKLRNVVILLTRLYMISRLRKINSMQPIDTRDLILKN